MDKKFFLGETKEYGLFNELSYNRDISPQRVDELVESIRKFGLTQPIVVSKDRFIIDGQHRLRALTRLGLPVWYVTISNYTAEQVAEINNTQKGWRLVDYVKSSANRGDVNCQKLQEMFVEYSDITESVVTKIFSEDGNRGISVIRSGQYRLNLDRGHKIMGMLETLSDFLKDRDEPSQKVYGSRFAEAFYKVVLSNDNFDVGRLINGLSSRLLRFYDNTADNAENIVDVYNKSSRGDNRISI